MSDLSSDSSLILSSKLQQFTIRLDDIGKAVQDLKGFTTDLRRCCRVTIKIISDCREAVTFTNDDGDVQRMFELGAKALQILCRTIQDAFSQNTIHLRKWKTSTVVRRLNLESEECLRSSVLMIMLDQMYAHAATKETMNVDEDEEEAVYEPHEDFFKLINKAFLVSFGDEINLEVGQVHSIYGIQIEASKVTDDKAWRLKMASFAGRVLTALACSQSRWFHNQEIRIANQDVSASDQADEKPKRKTGELRCRLHPAEGSRTLLSEIEKINLDQQRIALNTLLKSTCTDVEEYGSKVHWGLAIVKASVEAIQSSTDPPQLYSNQLFFYAKQALTYLANAASEWFLEDVTPLPLTAFNPDLNEPELEFPEKGDLAEQREWVITGTLNSLYERKARDSDRIVFAEAVLGLCSGVGMPMPDRVLVDTWYEDDFWRQVMLKSSSYALVGVAQHVLEYFTGNSIVLFKKQTERDNNEVPRARDQNTEKWLWAHSRPPSARSRFGSQ